MAKTTKNTDLVPREALEQLKQLDSQLESTTEQLRSMLKPVSDISNELAKTGINYKDLIDLIKKYEGVQKPLSPLLTEREKLLKKISELEKRLAAAESNEVKEIAKLNIQLQQKSRENKLAAKETLAHANSIEEMRVRLSRMKAEWATLDTGSDRFKNLTKDISTLNAEISKQEQGIGVWGRNVGNYASGFSMLNFQIQQVARELPSLTVSASQFFLAISNNLPMIVDEMQRARIANEALKKSGESTVPVWKQMIKGILSWQTALVVGITLLTAYSKEIVAWVKELLSVEKELSAVERAQKRVNEEMAEGVKNAGEEIARLRLLFSTAKNTTLSLEERNRAVDELQDKYPGYLGNMDKEKILAGDIGDAYDNITEYILSAARAQAAFNAAVKSSEEEMTALQSFKDISKTSMVFNMFPDDDEKFVESLRKRKKELEAMVVVSHQSINSMSGGFVPVVKNEELENINKIIKAYEEYGNKAAETEAIINGINLSSLNRKENEKEEEDARKKKEKEEEKLQEKLREIAESERKAKADLTEEDYKTLAGMHKRVVEDSKQSYDKRMESLQSYNNYLLQSVETRKNAEIEALIETTRKELKLPDTSEGRLKAREKVANQILLIEQKASIETNKIANENAKIQKKIEEDRVENVINDINEEYAARQRALSIEESNELVDLSRQHKDGKINNEQYEQAKLDTSKKYAKKRFENEISYLNDILKESGLTDEERIKYERELDKANLNFQKWILSEEVKDYDKAAKKKEKIEKALQDKRKELLRGAFDLAQALLNRDLENQLSKLDEQSEANDKWAEEETDRIDRLEESGAISKEQAEARKALIDEQAQAREDQIEAKRRELQKKQAQYEKAASLMEVAYNTAVAVMAAWKNPFTAPALIPTIIAAGAIQTATILATPIPEYAEGTKDHPGGLAIVGDAGKSEMVITNGKIFKTPAVDTLVNLPEHSKVLPDFNEALNLPDIPSGDNIVNIDTTEIKKYIIENNHLLKKFIARMERDAKNAIYERELNRLKPTKR